MHRTVRRFGFLLLVSGATALAACASPSAAPTPGGSSVALASRYQLIPWPRKLEARGGSFPVGAATRVVIADASNAELRSVADFASQYLRAAAGVPVPVTTGAAGANTISLQLRPELRLPAEGYRLDVTPRVVTLTASTPAGLFYGVQTLRQLLPATPGAAAAMPAVEIEDAPRFSYRGMHLDVGRHFFGPENVKQYIDMLAMYKLNTFHWHLTEDQGWRIEIKKYPKLTEVGSCRAETRVGLSRSQPAVYDNTRYCGYYTQEQIKDVVAYATARHVTIIPEIELPGHSVAALAAYPELACTAGPFQVHTTWGITPDIYCPKEETFAFLTDVLNEVMDLFPGPYVHVGGDEAPKTRWNESPVAQAVMQREGLKTPEELQSYFIKRIEKVINARGKKMIGWDEIVEGGLSPTATVMYWRDQANAGVGVKGDDPAHVAASHGNDLIMTPNQTLYFDKYQAGPQGEPLAIGGMAPLKLIYDYEPIPSDFTPEQAKHVLGAQANLWTEYIPTWSQVQYMVLPRMLALAELDWTPKELKNYDSFYARTLSHLPRLKAQGWNYHTPLPTDGVQPPAPARP
jgi:hexosaminidase